jgi:hypothetical protein
VHAQNVAPCGITSMNAPVFTSSSLLPTRRFNRLWE